MNLTELFDEMYQQAERRILIPSTLALETTNICNASCVMCPRHSMTRTQGIMDMESHKKIIDRFDVWRESIRTVSHAGIGEPLIDKELPNKIKYEKTFFKHAAVNVYTNGSLMGGDSVRALRDAGTDLISISLNAYYEDSYEKIMKLPMKRTLENIFCAMEILSGSATRIMVSLIPQNILKADEVSRFLDFWSGYGIQTNIPPLISWGGNVNLGEKECRLPGKQFPCFYLWEVILIDWQGKCRVCCEDFDSAWSPGNIFDKTPDVLFNSDYMNHFRRMHIKGNFTFCPLCTNCVESGEPAELYWRSLSQ